MAEEPRTQTRGGARRRTCPRLVSTALIRANKSGATNNTVTASDLRTTNNLFTANNFVAVNNLVPVNYLFGANNAFTAENALIRRKCLSTNTKGVRDQSPGSRAKRAYPG